MSRLNALLPLIAPMVAVAALSACAPREVILTGERLDPRDIASAEGPAVLGEPGVTMAVAQLRVLAEPDGVLDGLEAQGYEIEGPAWKADGVVAGSSGLSSPR